MHVCCTDEKITIDQVIQQLEELIPNWEALGRAAEIQPSVLKEVSEKSYTCDYMGGDRGSMDYSLLLVHFLSSVKIADHFKDAKDCFVEVINQVFIPNKTMWADLIALCDEAGFEKMSNDLQEAYRTGQYV